MKNDFIDTLLEKALKDSSTRTKLILKMKDILDSDEVTNALKDNILNTIKRMDFEDRLYEILTEDENVFQPICSAIKRKLTKILE